MIGKTRQPGTTSTQAQQTVTVLVGVAKARGILQAAPGPGRFWHERHAPTAPLDTYVEHYWSVHWDLAGHPPQQRETLPHPSAHLLIERGRSRIAGVATGRFSRMLEGVGSVFGVKFKPAGFQPFLGTAMAKLCNRSCAISDVFGHAADALENELIGHEHTQARIEVAAQFLGARLPTADSNVARVNAIVYGITDDRSINRADDLVQRHGLNLRSLQRLFSKYVGVSPKWVINRYRLHEAIERIGRGDTVDWAELALTLGYYDQAHFIHDFKLMIGKSPGDYAASK